MKHRKRKAVNEHLMKQDDRQYGQSHNLFSVLYSYHNSIKNSNDAFCPQKYKKNGDSATSMHPTPAANRTSRPPSKASEAWSVHVTE